MGVNVHQARSGQHAAEMLEACSPDVILLESDPSGSEMQACRKIRTEQQFTGMIGVWVTPPYSAAEWLNNGANAFLHQSSDDAVLMTTMRSLLRARKAERELVVAAQKIERLEHALLQAQQDFHQFALRVSHDFQESARAVTIFSQLIAEERRAGQQDHEQQYRNHLVSGTQRMRALLDSILLYSQAASDNAAAYGMVDLKSAVQGALKALQPAIVESGARVEADPLLPVVWANLLRLQQVFQGLIGNAIAFRRPDCAPEVHITCGEPAPGEWLISVRDNGIGIGKQYHQAIFAPFKRLHGREIPGSGLGLAICRRIVEAHGGRIWAESSTEGSTFMFTLREGPLPHEPLQSSLNTSPSNSPIFKNS